MVIGAGPSACDDARPWLRKVDGHCGGRWQRRTARWSACWNSWCVIRQRPQCVLSMMHFFLSGLDEHIRSYAHDVVCCALQFVIGSTPYSPTSLHRSLPHPCCDDAAGISYMSLPQSYCIRHCLRHAAILLPPHRTCNCIKQTAHATATASKACCNNASATLHTLLPLLRRTQHRSVIGVLMQGLGRHLEPAS